MVREGMETASYTVYKVGSTYYAKSHLHGGTNYSGADASTVINNAITALTNGGRIFFKAGTYTITASIVIDYDGITLEGESRESTILDTDGDIDLIQLSIAAGTILTDVVIKNLYLKRGGTEDGYLISSMGITDTHHIVYLKVLNCVLEGVNSNYAMIGLENPEMTNIEDCKFTTWSDNSTGILIQATNYAVGNVYLHRNMFTIGADKDDVTFVKIENSASYTKQVKRFYAFGNHFYNVSSTNIKGIHIYAGTTGDHFEENFIESNTFEKITYGIYLQGTAAGHTVRFSEITNNHFLNNTGESGSCGIKLDYTINNLFFGSDFRNVMAGVIETNGFAANPNKIEDNIFASDVTSPIISTTAKIRGNRGWTTENWGVAEASDNDWITHSMDVPPKHVFLTVEEIDDSYFAQVRSRNSTQFQIYLYDDAGNPELVDKTIHWYAYLSAT